MNLNSSPFSTSITRKRILVDGIVQGVGFRPLVFALAQEFSLSGFIHNSVNGVEIELQGLPQNINRFKDRLLQQPPPLAEIIDWTESDLALTDSDHFEIRASVSGQGNQTLISPDMSICPDCLRELFDPNDRRYLYPFINCTNCGPRFTIIKGVPYDRPLTTMAEFELCLDCQREYDNPLDRRFHAQPNACPDCGPSVWFEEEGQPTALSSESAAFESVINFLLEGKIVAVKGLGGFHLVVDATNSKAVERLRQRKNREQKPLALMLPDPEQIERIARIDSEELKLLQSAQRPIVLLPKKNNGLIAANVAPNNRRLGIMLPYTPLHYILFKQLRQTAPKDFFPALIFTSANRSEEPIVIENGEARTRLADIADGYFMHNRQILVRADDSVQFKIGNQVQFMRRSRGYVPKPFLLESSGPALLAVGAELKNTICFLKEKRAFVSQHIGDLENLSANHFFESTVKNFQNILAIEPEIIVHDLHPGYFSTQWAKQQTNKQLIAVQHHHAHMASCMAENKLDGPVIGLILDGTGYGYDHSIWGAEILVGDFTQIERQAWLEPMPMPGGSAAINQPWRLAAGYLHQTFAGQIPKLPSLTGFPVEMIGEMIEKQINTPYSSSAGRLFDAVAALCGGRTEIHYEAQAAIELMQSIESMQVEPFHFEPTFPRIPIRPIIASLVTAIQSGQAFAILAARFHKTLIQLFSKIIEKISIQTGIRRVVLSGGVFQNEILLADLLKNLQSLEFQIYSQQLFPANDGGISLGQAIIARNLLEQNLNEVRYSERFAE